MTLVGVLEGLALDTWERLRDSQDLQIRFGEETITDLVLLELKRSRVPGIEVLQTNKAAESTQGTDWEWWIGSATAGWLRFAVQAKKLGLETMRYDALGHKVGKDRQIDLLLKFAATNRAIPLYCFFNFVSPVEGQKGWRCCESFNVPQLGCTLAPAAIVKKAIVNHGCRTFEWIHSHPAALPWRCIAKCARFELIFDPSQPPGSRAAVASDLLQQEAQIYPELPPEIESGRRAGRVSEFSGRFYRPEVVSLPHRVIVLDRDAT